MAWKNAKPYVVSAVLLLALLIAAKYTELWHRSPDRPLLGGGGVHPTKNSSVDENSLRGNNRVNADDRKGTGGKYDFTKLNIAYWTPEGGLSDDLIMHLELKPAQVQAVNGALKRFEQDIAEHITMNAVREVGNDALITKWTVPPFFDYTKDAVARFNVAIGQALSSEQADALAAGFKGEFLRRGYFELHLTLNQHLPPGEVFRMEMRDPRTGNPISSWGGDINYAESRLKFKLEQLPK